MIQSLLSRDYRHEMSDNEVENFAHRLKNELTMVNVDELSAFKPIKFYVRHLFEKENDNSNVNRIISEQISKADKILTELFFVLERDPQLIEYARESINQTLNVEFFGQIQPASFEVDKSAIEIYDENTCCFRVNIVNNKVVNNGEPIFFTSPYKKVIFLDNPFLFDTPYFYYRRFLRSHLEVEADSLLNPNNIISHNDRLRRVLRTSKQASVLEQTIINESLEKVKREINSVIPGSFEFSSNGDFYVQNGTKLKMANLATGSKVFSVIKILLEKGELGKSTMLILDEPEAHLHPAWQNRFAEMIVLLVKELEVNILLTTHSSNFVLALDAYMRKHKICKKTNFYQTQFTDTGMVNYVCANENIGTIYKDFLQYLSEVKMLRNECLRNGGEDS